jgi:hypothetical protein
MRYRFSTRIVTDFAVLMWRVIVTAACPNSRSIQRFRRLLGPELKNAVVAVAGTAPTVTITRGEPQRAVRCRNDCPQTPVLPDEQRPWIAQ